MKISKMYIAIFVFFLIFISVIYIYLSKDKFLKDTFNWKQEEGRVIKVYLNQHPYSEEIIKSIPEFERLTGIKVEYFISHETIFQKKVFHLLRNRPLEIDVFMTGPYYIWRNADDDLMENLNTYIDNSYLISDNYNFNDFHPNIIDSLKFKDDRLWALPLGFELTSTIYNENIFSELDLTPPDTLSELEYTLSQISNKSGDIIPLGIRGFEAWTSISSAYINLYNNYGLSDFVENEEVLIPKFNTKEAIDFTEKWIDLVRKYSDPSWENITWYDVSAKIGGGKYAIIFDADLVGYFQNIAPASKEKGHLNITKVPSFGNKNPVTNIWTWGLAINKNSKVKDASWLFIQYFTSKKHFDSALQSKTYLNPPRISILNSKTFTDYTSKKYRDFLLNNLDSAKVLMTPQPFAIEIMEEWMTTLLNIYNGEYTSVQEGLDELNKKAAKIIEERGAR